MSWLPTWKSKALFVDATCSGDESLPDDCHRKLVDNFFKITGESLNSVSQNSYIKYVVLEASLHKFLQHDNARPHTFRAAEEALKNPKFELTPHSLYSPELAPCDFNFLPWVKRDLKVNPYSSEIEVKAAFTSWVREKSEELIMMEWKNF